ncbi:Ppx/GppA phosphatase family protein [Hymenobacter weizhouensis]|uniref:Ppx/GppA phosphatase family protein n=1 Tax=Hymenobacter sp. YIM 151500-1 TaxID=2987689 RepID=UPI002226F0E8|nr:phosphatase [Hymenobacter sp. YIM 151500-1]UYZ62926.1 phosphatase [Hymenobacter sp. YIM 151500-1]
MHHRRLALIDMGTNTFHLLIVELPQGDELPVPTVLLRTKVGVKLGEGGISAGRIAPEAYARALHTLAAFQEEIELHQVTEVRATATSAVRVAQNGPELVQEIFEQTGIRVEVIPGDREAELIARGIRQAVPLGPEPHLLMDIGGGSVEFILASGTTIFWKQSFEIGAQRLLDKFFIQDPLPAAAVQAEQAYLAEVLAPLTAAVRQHRPVGLVGASGTFDTLCDLQAARAGYPELVGKAAPATDIALDSFRRSYELLLRLDHAGRLALPGMTPLRADMIVVACVLIDFVLTTYQLPHIIASAYALKEGLLAEMLGQ